MRKLTMPTAKATLDHVGGRENKAGDATVLPTYAYTTTLNTA